MDNNENTGQLLGNKLTTARQAEDGVFQVGGVRIGYAYILEQADPNLPSDSELVFRYDVAGNQIKREMTKITVTD